MKELLICPVLNLPKENSKAFLWKTKGEIGDSKGRNLDHKNRESFIHWNSSSMNVGLDNRSLFFHLAASLPFIILTLMNSPYKRGFYCDDTSIRYPYKADTITYGIMAGVTVPCTVTFVRK